MNTIVTLSLCLTVAIIPLVSGEGYLVTVNTAGNGWSSKGQMVGTLRFADGTSHSVPLIGPAGKKTEVYKANDFYKSAIENVPGKIEDLKSVSIQWIGKHGLLSRKEADPVHVSSVSASYSYPKDGSLKRSSDLDLTFCGASSDVVIDDNASADFDEICGRSVCTSGICKDV